VGAYAPTQLYLGPPLIIPLIMKGYRTILTLDVFKFKKEGCTEAEAIHLSNLSLGDLGNWYSRDLIFFSTLSGKTMVAQPRPTVYHS
jgi:hypothetical protein